MRRKSPKPASLLRERSEIHLPATLGAGRAMSKGKVCLVLLLLVGALVAVVVLAVFLTRPSCTPGLYLDAAVAADTQTCSNIGRYVDGLFCFGKSPL